MGNNLISKSEFAYLAGVNPSSVTKVSKTSIREAVVGKKIDANHPAALAYIAEKRLQAPAEGIDPLYPAAVESCRHNGRYSANSIEQAHKVGFDRAKRILETMKINGVVPNRKPVPNLNPQSTRAPVSAPPQLEPKPRGHRAASDTRKNADPYESRLEIPEYIQSFLTTTLGDIIEMFGTEYRFTEWLKATKEIEMINEKRLKNAQTKGELVSRELVKTGVIDPIDSAHTKLLTDGAKTIARRSVAMHQAGRTVEEIEVFVADQMTSFIRPMKSRVAMALKNV